MHQMRRRAAIWHAVSPRTAEPSKEPAAGWICPNCTKRQRGMLHRSHDSLTNPSLAVEPTTGEVHLRHHISPNGYYRGKKVVKTKGD